MIVGSITDMSGLQLVFNIWKQAETVKNLV